MKRRALYATALTLGLALACAGRADRGSLEQLEYKGAARDYILTIPDGYDGSAALPLVLYLHGGNGTAERSQRSSGFDAVARREGFFVLYPQALHRSWNVGFGGDEEREAAQAVADVDDVGFLSALLDHVGAGVRVDRSRVYVTGVSRGAMMTHRLLCERADLFVGAAPMIGGVPAPIWGGCAPARPVPLLVIQGDDDPLVPYEGGQVVVLGKAGGSVVATEDMLKRWRQINGCLPDQAPAERVFDVDADDGVVTRSLRWERGCERAPVELVRVEGGGHTWPGGAQYLPKRVIGAASRDLDAAEYIWASWRR